MERPLPPSQPVAPEQSQQPAPTPPPTNAGGFVMPGQQTPLAKPPKRFAGLKALLAVLLFIGGIVVAATLINQFIFQSYYVDGTSMTPTLQNDDRLIIDKVERTVSIVQGKHYIPKRGQVVVLNSSLIDQNGRSEQLIKRVIGLPGETLNIGMDGVVLIKNKDHPDGFNVNDELGLKLEPTYVDTPITITIPQNSVFVMGDNRGPGGSFDSRSFGPISTDKIEGRLLARIFPLNKTGFF